LLDIKSQDLALAPAPQATLPPRYQCPNCQGLHQEEEDLINDYSTGLFECSKMPSSLFISLFVPCASFGVIGSHLDLQRPDVEENLEEYPTPTFGQKLLHSLPYALVSVLAKSATPCLSLWQRYELRNKYQLKQKYLNDTLAHLCCHPCALAQDHREVIIRHERLATEYFKRQQQEQAADLI
jgi:Cys-rich protein (TIGR01571 family)